MHGQRVQRGFDDCRRTGIGVQRDAAWLVTPGFFQRGELAVQQGRRHVFVMAHGDAVLQWFARHAQVEEPDLLTACTQQIARDGLSDTLRRG